MSDRYPTLIRGGTLLVPDESHGVAARPGDLLINGGRIERLGESVERPPQGTRVLYASGCLVVPGWVQSHVHLYQSLFRGLVKAGDGGRTLSALESAHTPQSMRSSARLAVAELLLSGTTSVQAMESRFHPEVVLEVLVEAGLFAVCGRKLADQEDESAPGDVEPTEAALRAAVDLAEEWDGAGDGRVRVALTPRDALACGPALLREVASLAEAGGWRVHMEAATTADRTRRLRALRGSTTVELLEDLGLSGPRVGLAHGTWLEPEELSRLAASGTHLLHTPGSDSRRGAGVAPVVEAERRGVRSSLGADGAAHNHNLDPFREMQIACLLAGATGDPGRLPPRRVLAMATRGGAEALGLPERIGVLQQGAVANVVLVNVDEIHTTPAPDPLAALVHGARASDVRAVWLAGEQVVAGGRLTLWDEEQLRRDARREARELARRAGLA